MGIDIYRSLFSRAADDVEEDLTTAEKLMCLHKKVSSATIRCVASLAFASLGAGIFSYFHPSMGQWIGKKNSPLAFSLFSNLFPDIV